MVQQDREGSITPERQTTGNEPLSVILDGNPGPSLDLSRSGTFLDKVVVGEIISVTTILQSIGLKEITVDCGDRSYRTVSTSDELQVGMKTAFALLGARLNNNRYVQLQEISGVESHGRLCTAKDLGMKGRDGSVVKFPPHLKNGLRLAELIH